MIKVAEYDNPMHAEIARGKLESHDIPSFLLNKNTSSLYPDLGIVPVSLFVAETDAERAKKILCNDNKGTNE